MIKLGDHGLYLARKMKHAGFVAAKRARTQATNLKFGAATAAGPLYSRFVPYRFNPARYRRSFVVRTAPFDDAPSELPRRVFVLWTGDNDLTPNRARNLEVLRSTLEVPIELVTAADVARWTVPSHPIHPAYEHLSLVHRSDYLRAYLLHHHGGGYADMKAPVGSWMRAFERAAADPEAWLTSFGEIDAKASTRMSGAMGFDIAMNYRRLVGTPAMIVRSHTPFTGEWMREVERRMDFYAEQLAEFPGAVRGEVIGYPVSWTHLLGRVYQPLQLKYLEHVRVDAELLMRFTDYQ